MYYLRRFLAQMVDWLIITLIGAAMFYGSAHSPVSIEEKEWSLNSSPMYPSDFGFVFEYEFKPGEDEAGVEDEAVLEQSFRFLEHQFSDGRKLVMAFSVDGRWGLILLYGFYYTLFTGLKGWTPGKRLLRLQVVGKDGEKISLLRSLGRWVAYFPSGLLYVGLLWIFVDRDRRAWHDWLGGTRVIDSRE